MDWLMNIVRGKPAEPEDLCEELEKSKIRLGNQCMIKNRFFEMAEYKPGNEAWYNERLRSRRAEASDLMAANRWWEYVSVHAKEYYPVVLEEVKDSMPPMEWCKAVREAWYLSDVLWPNRDVWLRLFADCLRIAGVSDLAAERDYFASQPSPTTVYRGCLPNHVDGLSWSLSIEVAKCFKRELGAKAVVFSGKVDKRHVLAYLNPNNEEFEIVVAPEHVSSKLNLG
jgi:hypothetical protein